jgi:hypothetical protein
MPNTVIAARILGPPATIASNAPDDWRPQQRGLVLLGGDSTGTLLRSRCYPFGKWQSDGAGTPDSGGDYRCSGWPELQERTIPVARSAGAWIQVESGRWEVGLGVINKVDR